MTPLSHSASGAIESLARSYGITAQTPATGELRATPRWWSGRSFDTHVNTRGQTGGTAEQKKNRQTHRAEALDQVAKALRESIRDHGAHIEPSERMVHEHNFRESFKKNGVTVGLMRRLKAFEDADFEGFSIPALTDSKGVGASDRFAVPPARQRVATPALVSEADFASQPAEIDFQQGGHGAQPVESERVESQPVRMVKVDVLQAIKIQHPKLQRDERLGQVAAGLLKLLKANQPGQDLDAFQSHPVFKTLSMLGADARPAQELARDLYLKNFGAISVDPL